jgi:Dopey, N-terminal
VIPSKAIVARRLAQCLNPALPSGVHQKALEVYNYIFSMIGKDALSQDLSLYFPGLSSTLSFASLTVRAPFLTLLETHLLQLDPSALRPALKALILSLLPGLEEETSEDFERTLELLGGFKLAIRSKGKDNHGQQQSGGDEYFWQCFFLASITGKSRRLGALAYLTRNLPRLGPSYPQDSINSNTGDLCKGESDVASDKIADVVTSPEPGLLLRCFAAGLADDQILIQRGFLDLLVTHLPLNARVLQSRVKQDDLELLLIAASGVVIRRDMSLNRRLWAWLLGPEQPSRQYGDGGIESPLSANTDAINAIGSSRTRYFEEYGLQPLTRAIFKMIQRDHSTPVERAKPFRICLSLMDRWEIGGLIVPEIFLPVINSVRRYQSQSNTKADLNEVLRSASVFFDGVESGLIWGEIAGLIAGAIGVSKATEAERMDKLSLVRFILAHFNVREEEMLLVHAPTATVAVLVMIEDFRIMTETSSSTSKRDISKDVLGLAMSVAMDLVELIPERALDGGSLTSQSSSHDRRTQQWDMKNSEVLEKIRIFYVQDQGNLELSRPPFSSQDVRELLVRRAGNIACQSLGNVVSVLGADVAMKTRLLVVLLKKSLKTDSLDVDRLLLSVHDKLSSSAQLPFSIFTSIITLITVLYSRSYISQEDMSGLINPLVCLAWSYLSASHPKYHVETVRNLWQLQSCLSLSNREIEAAICNLITKADISGTFAGRNAEPGRSFAVLWTHTLQDHTDRRGSKSSVGDSSSSAQTAGLGTWEVMLSRPLFLLLDALLDERTQLFMTVRAWLQSLVGADKLVFPRL